MSNRESVVAARLRRAAKAQDYSLTKNRTRDPLSADFGTYRLIDLTGDRPAPSRSRMTLRQVSDYLLLDRTAL